MKPPAPPLNALRAFEAFARHGSMTAAGAELCVTHGAVSRQVRALQEALGVALVTGPRHELVLTPAGAELAASLSAAFMTIGDAVALARAGRHREIEVSCLGTLALKWLIPRLSGFLAAHPDIRVRISESHAPVDFTRDRFDAAIRMGDPGDRPPRAEATPFMAQHQGLVVAPHLAPEDLADLPRLRATSFPESWARFAALTGLILPPAGVEREFAHYHSMIEAAAAGMGVAPAPWAFVAPDIAAGRLVAPLGFSEEPWRFVLLRPEGRPDAAIDAFRDWLVAEGARSPPPIPSTGPGAGTRRWPPRAATGSRAPG